jgi:hypothetical protein
MINVSGFWARDKVIRSWAAFRIYDLAHDAHIKGMEYPIDSPEREHYLYRARSAREAARYLDSDS